jgi:COMPASS component SWD3
MHSLFLNIYDHSRIWDTSTGQCLKTLMDDTTPPVSCVKFAPNSKFLLASSMDDKIKLWDYFASSCLKTYQGHVNKRYCIIFALCYSDDLSQNWVVSGSEDNSIYIWDLQSRKILKKIDQAHSGMVNRISKLTCNRCCFGC